MRFRSWDANLGNSSRRPHPRRSLHMAPDGRLDEGAVGRCGEAVPGRAWHAVFTCKKQAAD